MTPKECKELYEQKLKYFIKYHSNQLQNILFSSVHLDEPSYDIYTRSIVDISSETVIRYRIHTNELIKIYSNLFALPFESLMNTSIDTLGLWSIRMKKENYTSLVENYKITILYDYRPSRLQFISKDTNMFGLEIMLQLLLYDPIKAKYINPTLNLYYTEDHEKDLELFYKDIKITSSIFYDIDNKRRLPDYLKHTPLYDLIEGGELQLLRTDVLSDKEYFTFVIPSAIYTWYNKQYTWAQTIHIVEN